MKPARIVPVPDLHDPCSYCQVIINHFHQHDRAIKELRACGVLVTFGAAPIATHFIYPFSGHQAGNAQPICDRHVLLIRGIEEHGSLDAYIAHLQAKADTEKEQHRVLALLDAAREAELAKEAE